MKAASTETLPTRRLHQSDAARLQQSLVRLGLNTILFVCGLCAWVFKLKGDGSVEGGLLPYSPLQVLIPLLGIAAVPWLLIWYGGRLPHLLVRRPSSVWLGLGIVLIVLGTAVHLRGGGAKDAALFIMRWLLPVGFLLFFAVTRTQRVSPLALLLGLAGGAVLSAVSVEAYRSLGISLPVSAPMAGRYGGYLSHPNQYGILCSTTAGIIIFFYHSRHRWLRAGALLLPPVYLLCLFQNLSKTNIVLFFLSLFLCSLAVSLKNPRKLLATFALAAGLTLFLALTIGLAFNSLRDVSPKAAKVLEDAFFNPAEAKSVDSREVIWETAIRHIKEHPFVGLGPGKSPDALGIDHAHNVLLQLYLDAGLTGFIGICFVILAVFWRNAELLWAEITAREEIDDVRMLRLVSGISMIIYLLANAMSDCFSTATMPAFMFFAALAFAAEPPPAASPARRGGGRLHRRAADAPPPAAEA